MFELPQSKAPNGAQMWIAKLFGGSAFSERPHTAYLGHTMIMVQGADEQQFGVDAAHPGE